MRHHGVFPDKFTFISILSVCTSKENLDKGKRLHALILNCGLHHNVVLATALITMYHKCGSLENAWNTFEKIPRPDEVSWAAIIAAYVQHGQNEGALHLFDLMLQEGFGPSKVAFACTVDACANSFALAEGKMMHACMIEYDIKPDMMLENSFVKLYGVCGSLDDAQHIYDNMQRRDLVSSNTLILAYAQHGQATEALLVFDQLLRGGAMPNKVTYICILDACVTAAAEAEGKQMHGYIVDAGFDKDIMMETKLVKLYGKCGRLKDAQRLFEKMQEHNVVSWTTIIAVFAQQGKSMEALHFFHQMQQEGTKPNRVTFVCMLDACASLAALVKGRQGHLYILNCGFELDIVVSNSLISMYGKCGSIEDAWKVFDKMPQHDLVSWTAMIGVYAQHHQGKGAVQLFGEMQQEVDANKVTFVCVIDACTGSAMLVEGKQIHFCIINDGFETDVEVVNALVNMYGKCGSVEDALRLFDSTPEHNVISWTALIGAHAQRGQTGEAVRHFAEMQQQGVMPNKITFVSILDIYASETALIGGKHMHARIMESGFASDVTMGNSLIKMYGKCHSIDDAWKMFDRMLERDVITWTAIIAVYAQHWKGKRALQLFDQMQHEGFQPNKITFVCVLDACASCAALATGEYMHGLILHKKFDSNVVIGTALVNMYGKCGNISSARCVFDKMSERNVLSWTAIVAIYAQHGKGKEAVSLFEKMEHEGFKPDDVTLVSLLAACSHSGLVDEGCLFFTTMISGGNISPNVEHYVCMIDLLGRAGRLNEAETLVHDMPFKATAATLMSLLGSCRYQGDFERGERAAMRVFDLDSEDPAPYVMLSNIYAAAGREDDAAAVLSRARDKNSWKQLGCCSIEVNNKVHEFLAKKDCWHPQQDMIHSKLQRLMVKIRQEGYISE